VIVRVFNRQVGRDVTGELRHTVSEDYIPALRAPKLGIVFSSTNWELFRQPANDMMWVPKAEWQAMMPANPKTGQRVKVPASLCERIFRFQLDPARGLGESDCFDKATANAGKLELTVEEVKSNDVRMRLDGYVHLHNPRAYLLNYQGPAVKQHSKSQIPLDYQPRLLGHLSYDPAKKVFTRFDMVALGDIRG